MPIEEENDQDRSEKLKKRLNTETFVNEGKTVEVIIKQILLAYQPDLLICGSFIEKSTKIYEVNNRIT